MRRSALLLSAALVLAACGDDGSASSDPVALEGSGGDTTTGGAATDDATEGDADGGVADPGVETTSPGTGVVDGSVAEPGTWQVGDAGTVTFSLQDGRLVLDDVSPADGWSVTEEEVEDDEIDVDLERGNETYEFQVDLEDGGSTLRVDIDHDIDGADPGTFELGDAGSVIIGSDGDRLVLEDLTVADGWELATREEDGDEIEVDLVSGDRRWDLEVELDDDRLDVERDYEVRGTV